MASDRSDHRSRSAPAAIDTRSLQVLADAGTLLATALDVGKTVQRVGDLTVPALAELCLLHLFTPGDDGGEVKRVLQVMHPYAGTTEWAPPIKLSRLASDNPISIAVRTQKLVRVTEVENRDLVAIAADEGRLPEVRSIRPRTLLCLPLVGRERVLGTLTLVSSGGAAAHDLPGAGPRWGLAEVAAPRVAWALDSALAHEASERARRGSDEARVVLEAANQMRDTFLASLSHELRTPLAALLLWVDILRTAKEGPMRARALNAIHASAMSQSKLIEDLLDISRCLSGKLLMENRVVSAGGLIDSALEAALPSARAKGVRLESDCPPAIGCVLGDSGRLRQVLGNLLSNAIKFTDRGGLVTVRAVGIGTRVEISVVDTGCGIASDFLPQVFLPFRQSAGTIPRTQVGLGLGLAIVRQLVEMHEGTVRAESAGLGRGSTFVVALPLVAARSVVDVSRGETPSRRSLAALRALGARPAHPDRRRRAGGARGAGADPAGRGLRSREVSLGPARAGGVAPGALGRGRQRHRHARRRRLQLHAPSARPRSARAAPHPGDRAHRARAPAGRSARDRGWFRRAPTQAGRGRRSRRDHRRHRRAADGRASGWRR